MDVLGLFSARYIAGIRGKCIELIAKSPHPSLKRRKLWFALKARPIVIIIANYHTVVLIVIIISNKLHYFSGMMSL